MKTKGLGWAGVHGILDNWKTMGTPAPQLAYRKKEFGKSIEEVQAVYPELDRLAKLQVSSLEYQPETMSHNIGLASTRGWKTKYFGWLVWVWEEGIKLRI